MENENIEEKQDIAEESDENITKVYELGYLLLPTTPEEDLAGLDEKFKEIIRENGGNFISEDFPKIRGLAYKMKKSIENKNQVFERAYFGWIKFEANSSSVVSIKEQLTKENSFLRFMIVKTVKENTVSLGKTATVLKRAELSQDSSDSAENVSISEEEIDKSIEELVV